MTTRRTGAGDLTEQLTIWTTTPVAVGVTSITRSGATATVTTPAAHGFTDGDFVTIAGAAQAGYNLDDVPITVTGASTFTYTVDAATVTPATTTSAITATFQSHAQGGQGAAWRTLATVWGRMRPLSAREILAAKAIRSTQIYEGTIYSRVPQDITPMMRLSWTPYGYDAAKTLEIHGVLPDKDEPRRLLVLDVGEVL